MDQIMIQAVEFIKMVGFPAFVCLWFMLRTDRKLDKLADLIAEQNKGDKDGN